MRSSLSPARRGPARPSWAARAPLRAVCGSLAPGRGGVAGAHRRRRRDREPAPLPVHFERMDSLRRPCELPSPPCVARRAGAPSAMRQLGELAQKTLALHPTSAGSAISSTDFVGSSSPPIFSYLKCSDCGCPSTRTRQSVRAQTWPFLGCTHRPSSTSTSRPRLRRGATGGARPPGEALGGGLLRGGGCACDTAPREPWSPGDRRMRGA